MTPFAVAIENDPAAEFAQAARGASEAGLDSATIALAVGAEQIRLLYRQRAVIYANLIIALGVANVVHRMFPKWLLVLWLAVFCVVVLARALLRSGYLRTAPTAPMARRWGYYFTLGTVATGFLWGFTGLAVLMKAPGTSPIFIVFVLGGMMAGGIMSNAVYLPALLGFMLPAILPTIALLLTSPDSTDIEMGLMLLAFSTVLAVVGRNINRSIVSNLRLRIAQDSLLAKFRVSEAAMAEAQAIAHVGSWEFDPNSKRMIWSREIFEILGLAPALSSPSAETVLARIHPDDRVTFEKHYAHPAGPGTVFEFDHRIVMDDGGVKWAHEIGRATFDPDGRPSRLFGTTQDITEQKRTATALAYRDRLTHAVTVGTGVLVKAKSLGQGMPEALRIIGECMQVDRVLVMQDRPTPVPTKALRYFWQSPDIGPPLDFSVFAAARMDIAVAAIWDAHLQSGKPVIVQRATSQGAIGEILDRLQNKSLLLVPIFADEKLWGNLGVDACQAARDWTASETDTLRTFADIAGSLILRDEARLLLETSEERFRVLSTAAQDAIVTIDGQGLISQWNRSAERILGYDAEEAVGRPVHEFMVPERFKEKAAQGLAAFQATGAGGVVGRTVELAALKKDGTEIAIELSLAGAFLGGAWQAMAIIRDVSDRKSVEAKLHFANMLLKAEMEASPDGIMIVNEHKKIISFNQRLADIWKISRSDLEMGVDEPVLAAVTASVKNAEGFAERVEYLYDHPGVTSQDELETTDGRFIDRHTVTLNGPGGGYLGRVWYFRDITSRKQADALAIRMARYDVLTGLSNRAVFVEEIQHAIAKAKHEEKGFALIYLDLDHFKDVNDTLGHPVGDALLKAVAERLRSNARDADIIARFGGDEFAMVVADIGEPADAALLAENLIIAIAEPFSIDGNQIHTGASLGIDLYGPEAPDAETLLSHADVALYRAKSEGRGTYRFFTEAMDTEVRERVSLGAELREAITSGQLFVLYQPQVTGDSGRIIGLEALVRWRHPTRGLLRPDYFIRVAEKTGSIVKLGQFVLRTACRQAKAWLDAGFAPVRMSVNVSPMQFKTPQGLESEVAAVLKETGLPSQFLELELTETTLMDVAHDRNDVLDGFRHIGITIAIDDFGTGYSSLDYLRRFPVDRIKVAQNFVKYLTSRPSDAAIVKATIGLARELDIAVIAEGVETLEQLELLMGWGCGEIQGFYFAKPLAADEITRLFQNGGIITPAAYRIDGAGAGTPAPVAGPLK